MVAEPETAARLLFEPRTPKRRALIIPNQIDMKQKKILKGGSCDLHTLKNLKAELAQLRRDRDTEKRKALLTTIQRDYFRSLSDYANDYLLSNHRTEEEDRKVKENYVSFSNRIREEYGEEAKPLVLDLYKKYLGARYTLTMNSPYQSKGLKS